MDSLESLSARARRVRSFVADDGDAAHGENDVSRVYRYLRLVKLTLVIVATALTIARMLGWL
ncbi:hypothetical protein [Halococcus saccharolyticus]|uniref:Uncharacterized protein n=1 Tax=Halococcus saccharolyticus DSM 5350 TaxID=1227455 RepID=M0MED5_9EURY|nr:hypothetical protein [Halococcus saccharolyticus]EMA44091.1 hypothetical protein C449_11213 [Halococcus saccharolyticus DSM 5350]